MVVRRTESDRTANGIRLDGVRNLIGRRTESDWAADANGRKPMIYNIKSHRFRTSKSMAFFVCYGLFLFVYGLTRSGGLRPPQQAAEQCVGWVLRRPDISATERLESLELQAQRLRAQYHLSAVELLLYELLLKVVYAVRSQ